MHKNICCLISGKEVDMTNSICTSSHDTNPKSHETLPDQNEYLSVYFFNLLERLYFEGLNKLQKAIFITNIL